MGLKDKLKGAWNRISDLEDDSAVQAQSAESERIPFKAISKKLKELMKKNVDVVGRKILIPSYYSVHFSEYDRQARAEVETVLCDELKEEIYPEMRRINPEQNKRDILVEVKTDASLERGDFRIECSMKKAPAAAPGAPLPPTKPEPVRPPVQDVDLKATVVERPASVDPDEKVTVIQRPAAPTQFKLLVDFGNEKRELAFSKEKISIGRATQDDVVLESSDFSISRSHATIELKEGKYILLPLGVNGTFLNGEELELNKETTLSNDDEIKIMHYTMKLLA